MTAFAPAKCAGHETTECRDKDRVARTEHQIVTVGREAVSLGYALEAAADELPASNDRVEHGENVSQGARFIHIAVAASTEGLLHDLQ